MSTDEFDLTMTQSAKTPGRRKNNYTATTDPGAGDDSADDYEVGSEWINVTLDKSWKCVDSTAAAAVWIEGGGGSLDFGEVGDIVQIDYADAASAGSTGEVADAGHQHAVNAKFQHAAMIFEFGPAAAVNDYHLIQIPFDFQPTDWSIMGDVSGSCSVDLWMDTFANGQPTNADSITASATPGVTTALSNSSSSLTGWDTSWVKGDMLKVVVESLTTMTQLTLTVNGLKT